VVVSTGVTLQLAVVLATQVPPVQLYDVGELVQLAVSVEDPARDTLLGFGTRVQIGAPAGTPTPLTATACGLPVALSVTRIELDVVTAVAGLKVTFRVQLALAARLEPQSFVTANTLLALAMLVMVSAALPVLVRVTVLVALVVPTFWLAKVRVVGLSVTPGALAATTKAATISTGAAGMLKAQGFALAQAAYPVQAENV
jgi:hypothetical protein